MRFMSQLLQIGVVKIPEISPKKNSVLIIIRAEIQQLTARLDAARKPGFAQLPSPA
jgi:hypothetical protein